MRYGQADGHGRYGILDTDDAGRLVCHECGAAYDHLTTHAAGAHGIRAAEYRQRHGLARSVPLVSERVRERMRAAWERNASLHLRELSAHRDPDTARAESMQVTAGQSRTPGALASYRAARTRAAGTLPVELATQLEGLTVDVWCQVTARLLADGWPLAACARASGITPGAAEQRMRRWRRGTTA